MNKKQSTIDYRSNGSYSVPKQTDYLLNMNSVDNQN